MITALIFSAIPTGLIATAVMLIVLYVPLLWGGRYYDSLGSLGALLLGTISDRARLLGAMIMFAGGVMFAVLYGAIALMFIGGPFPPPDFTIQIGPASVNLFFILLGAVGGFGQGVFLSLLSSFIVTDHHPVNAYRDTVDLILSYLIGHTVYGVVAMFFLSQFLPILL